MELAKIIGIAIITAIICLVLKGKNDELCFAVAAAGGVVMLVAIIKSTAFYLVNVRNYFEQFNINTASFSVVLKALGICYLCQFAADLCRDFGQTAIAGKVELAGKCLILLLCAPLVGQITKIAAGYMV